jgi:hypothetical protein
MLKVTLLLSTLAILNVSAQSTRINETLESWTARRLQETPPRLDETKPNEIKVGKLTYSGIAVEAVQLDNPLQLINPAAPVQYGFAEANLVRDPVVGRVSGLKIFSIQF